jgi:hypothetical protein
MNNHLKCPNCNKNLKLTEIENEYRPDEFYDIYNCEDCTHIIVLEEKFNVEKPKINIMKAPKFYDEILVNAIKNEHIYIRKPTKFIAHPKKSKILKIKKGEINETI